MLAQRSTVFQEGVAILKTKNKQQNTILKTAFPSSDSSTHPITTRFLYGVPTFEPSWLPLTSWNCSSKVASHILVIKFGNILVFSCQMQLPDLMRLFGPSFLHSVTIFIQSGAKHCLFSFLFPLAPWKAGIKRSEPNCCVSLFATSWQQGSPPFAHSCFFDACTIWQSCLPLGVLTHGSRGHCPSVCKPGSASFPLHSCPHSVI